MKKNYKNPVVSIVELGSDAICLLTMSDPASADLAGGRIRGERRKDRAIFSEDEDLFCE